MRRRRAWTAAATVLAVVAASWSCADDVEAPQRCTDIPAGGCPLSRGVACDDPECESVYACRPGNVWELSKHCPPRDPRTPRDASVAEDAEPSSVDANVDAPPGAFGGPGCADLQAPDCALGIVLACPAGCCGCEDLFVCEEGGWEPWGACGDAGIQR